MEVTFGNAILENKKVQKQRVWHLPDSYGKKQV